MRLVQNKFFGVVYWVVAFVASIVGAVVGARAATGSAPQFGDGAGTSVGSSFVFGAGGALLAGAAVAAFFVVVWMALWAADRRAHPQVDSRDDYDGLDALDEDFDAAERRHRGFDDDADGVVERDEERVRTH